MSIQASFELFDIQGRKLATRNVIHGEKVDMQEFSKGIYIYNLTTNGTRYTGRFIKN